MTAKKRLQRKEGKNQSGYGQKSREEKAGK